MKKLHIFEFSGSSIAFIWVSYIKFHYTSDFILYAHIIFVGVTDTLNFTNWYREENAKFNIEALLELSYTPLPTPTTTTQAPTTTTTSTTSTTTTTTPSTTSKQFLISNAVFILRMLHFIKNDSFYFFLATSSTTTTTTPSTTTTTSELIKLSSY